MAFKSEIHVAELASIRTGHTEGDIYYILDNGRLDDLPCKPGTFVKWHNDAWQTQPDEHYALASAVDGEIAQAIDNVLDDGSASETIVVAVPSSQSSDYTVGNYYEVQGKVAKLRTKTEGDNVTQLTFDTTSGVLEAINNSTGKIAVFEVTFPSGVKTYPNGGEILDAIGAGKYVVIDQPNLGVLEHTEWLLEYASRGAQDYIKFVNGSSTLIATRDNTADEPTWQWDTGFVNGIVNGGSKTESNLVGGALAIGGGNSLTRLTLTTVQTLTVLANAETPNFALEIDNTGNSNDVTVTVKDSTGTTTLNASVAGGNTVGTGKYYQLTCVGSCWTLAEFTVPTP